MCASLCKDYPHKFLASRTQYYDHKTAINFSRLESFACILRFFAVSGHMLSEKAQSKVMYHTAHCLYAIVMIFLHRLMTLVAHVNSGFVSLQIVFQVMIPEVQRL